MSNSAVLSNSAFINGSNSATGTFLKWLNENIWLVIADLIGITLFLAIVGAIILDQWLLLMPAFLPIIVGIASLVPVKNDMIKPITPVTRRNVSDIRIVITPREDDYGYGVAA